MRFRCVTGAGGTYAFADTDSRAIVAAQAGGLVPCPGGPHRTPEGDPAIRALSWAGVDAIVIGSMHVEPITRQLVELGVPPSRIQTVASLLGRTTVPTRRQEISAGRSPTIPTSTT